jgi:hypothetical protein
METERLINYLDQLSKTHDCKILVGVDPKRDSFCIDISRGELVSKKYHTMESIRQSIAGINALIRGAVIDFVDGAKKAEEEKTE